MEITRSSLSTSRAAFPAIQMVEPGRRASVILIHGYGGCKEETLGLSFRIFGMGFNTFAIDLNGHGENPKALDLDVLDDVNSLVETLERTGPVTVLGHSLGGRLALLSRAPRRIGLSPALERTFSRETVHMVHLLRSYRVRQAEEGINFRILRELPEAEPSLTENDHILYGSRDLPEVMDRCQRLAKAGRTVHLIQGAYHGDMIFMEETFGILSGILKP
jgi:hypothetical protein